MLKQIIKIKSLILISAFSIIVVSCGNSQTSAFQYNGHPVHPLLIKKLLPDPETKTSIGCISLDSISDIGNIETVIDSSIVNSGVWYLSYFSETGYVDYHFVSMYKDDYCVIVRDVDGSLPTAYVCFLSVQNNNLCLDGYLEVQNVRDDLIKVSGDDLLIGSVKHSIKTIIHSKIESTSKNKN